VDVLYEEAERREEFDEEPFSPEDLAAIKEGEEAFQRGEFISLEDYEKERGLLATACNYHCRRKSN